MSTDPKNDREEESAPTDDRVIGRALRISGVLLILLLAAGAAVYAVLHRAPPKPVEKVTQRSAPESRVGNKAEVPPVKFQDITASAGIQFVHNNGAYGDKLLPETMGGGVAFLDYDGDGNQDLLFINSTYWPGKVPEGKSPTTMALYHNDGKGHFQDVTHGSGLNVSFYGMGVAVGDYDNDGLTDIFVTGVGGCHLFHNEGAGKFKEVTAVAGVGGSSTDWGTSAAWFDYDNDGKLDLFVCNYVQWSRETDFEVGYSLTGVGRAYGQPTNFKGTHSRLYHNDGQGHFSDMSAQAGIQVKNPATGVPAGKALGVAPVDLNGDGWVDIVVANDTVQNFVFINQRDGTFKESGALMGIAYDPYGNTRGAMGVDSARYRNDAAIGIAIGNFANEMTALYVSQKDPMVFTDESIAEGIGPDSRLLLKFGLFFFDYDLDGRLDLLSVNGHLEEEISKVQKSQKYAQPAQLFWNTGGSSQGTFQTVTAAKCGDDLLRPIVGRGSAYADVDGDGNLDVVLTQIHGAPMLLRNQGGSGNHWIRLKLRGKTVNRDAIGVWVTVMAGGVTQSRQVMPTKSYLSQSELPLTFGLGKSTNVDSIEIQWTREKKQKLESVELDRMTVIEEPSN